MDKITEQVNKIEKIIKYIDEDKTLKSNSTNINKILEIKKNKDEKKKLDKKINKISLFTNKLALIVDNLQNPNTLDQKLVEYTGYLTYYNKNKPKNA